MRAAPKHGAWPHYAVVLGAALCALPHLAAAEDVRAERQAMVSDILNVEADSNVARDRVACVTGEMAHSVPRSRSAGFNSLPDASDYCVAVLVRSARDGVQTLLRGRSATTSTPASAFDNGFMLAFQKGEALPSGLPTMAMLKPIAERCFAMSEPDVSLCYAAGYAFGQRAYHGENLVVR
jgi:hypothetical protein